MIFLVQSIIPAEKKSISPNAALTIFRAEVNCNAFVDGLSMVAIWRFLNFQEQQKLVFPLLLLQTVKLQMQEYLSASILYQSITFCCSSDISELLQDEYNASIEFFWAPLLVESNSDDPVNHRLSDRIIRPESILKHGTEWKDAGILVFNLYLWRRSEPKDNRQICNEASGIEAMNLALETWADWIDSSIDPLKQKVFVTMSPTHLWGWEWNSGNEGNCYQEKYPISREDYWGSVSDPATMRMVDQILGRLASKVSVLNIAQLSEYRKDGHPSVYRKFWEALSMKQLAKPASYADCIHWCLPGVPDVWTELLFNSL